jgi:hypothetical protein
MFFSDSVVPNAAGRMGFQWQFKQPVSLDHGWIKWCKWLSSKSLRACRMVRNASSNCCGGAQKTLPKAHRMPMVGGIESRYHMRGDAEIWI